MKRKLPQKVNQLIFYQYRRGLKMYEKAYTRITLIQMKGEYLKISFFSSSNFCIQEFKAF